MRWILLACLSLPGVGCTSFDLRASRTVPMDPPISSVDATRFVAKVDVGSMTIAASDEPGVFIEYEVVLRGIDEDALDDAEETCELEVTRDGRTLRIDSPVHSARDATQRDYRIRVRVGRDVAVDATVSVGAVNGVGLRGPKLRSSTGSVSLTGGRGAADLRTSVGMVAVRDHVGTLLARSSTGSIDAEIEALDGDGSVDCETSIGSVRLVVPANTDATVDAATSVGSITAPAGIAVRGDYTSKAATGILGGGGRTIRLVTSTGSIKLERADR